jgi:hypothetical protein
MRRALNEIKYGTCAATGRSVLSKKNTSNLAPLANEGYSGFANPVRLDLGHQRLVQVASSVSKVIERQNSAVFAAFSFLHARKTLYVKLFWDQFEAKETVDESGGTSDAANSAGARRPGC